MNKNPHNLKFKYYSLYLKWREGWEKYITIKNEKYPARHPREFLEDYVKNSFMRNWTHSGENIKNYYKIKGHN